MIRQHLYWPNIRNDFRMEFSNCDTFQPTKMSNKKYDKLPDNKAEEIPWNKLCVDLIVHQIICIKGNNKYLDLNPLL